MDEERRDVEVANQLYSGKSMSPKMVGPWCRHWWCERELAAVGRGEHKIKLCRAASPINAPFKQGRAERSRREGEAMPATAGRVPMPKGNRMETSGSLKTHTIWQNAIGYDPYAPESGEGQQQDSYRNRRLHSASASSRSEPPDPAELAALAKASRADPDSSRGLWKGRRRIKGLWEPGRGIPSHLDQGPPDATLSVDEAAHAAAALAHEPSDPSNTSTKPRAPTNHAQDRDDDPNARQKKRESSCSRHKRRKLKKRQREDDDANAQSDDEGSESDEHQHQCKRRKRERHSSGKKRRHNRTSKRKRSREEHEKEERGGSSDDSGSHSDAGRSSKHGLEKREKRSRKGSSRN